MPLEVLHLALVLFRCIARGESSQILSPAGLGIFLPGIEPILTGI
jgi:hypothetical protein